MMLYPLAYARARLTIRARRILIEWGRTLHQPR